ncbi:MAG TPA: dihydrofolate reductase family protein [Solirubrobacteraceae bacterium]|nr:dihydrofolate reductase family protein [Solirubrobacteraceae bacterium]
MTTVKAQLSISLDGFVAGPDQDLDNPIGVGGSRLHEWMLATASWRRQHGERGGERGPDDAIAAGLVEGIGAFIMGRKMFGGGDGDWDPSWTGWWGEDPPYHGPVYVLTGHPRDPLPMQGGTTFYFVTDGVESALEQARVAAGGQDVSVLGGASAVRQYLAAGLLDELQLHLVPIVLGAGERLFEDVGHPAITPIEVVTSPRVTHITYRLAQDAGRRRPAP